MASGSAPVSPLYYVALDLGSESMAAYCQAENASQGEMIDLVEHAQSLLGPNKQPVQYIFEEDRSRSPRLRTIISLEDNRQGPVLDDCHATLDFTAQYADSLLTYFHDKGSAIDNVMPNPKIPFQFGSEKIIPEVRAKGDGTVRHSPEVLLQNITAQVLRNFVLNSRQLRNVQEENIHLTLTVPNVYSLTHAESIRKFIESRFGFRVVDVLYESDALAYFALLASSQTDDPDLQDFRERIGARRGTLLRLATLDIGRGTTDLSLVQLDMPPGGGRGDHLVLGRTGSCQGGNSLSYIFAEYYNELLVKALNKYSITWTYDFLSRRNLFVRYQNKLSRMLEELIELVKRSITEDFRIEAPQAEQEQLIDRIIDEVLDGMVSPGAKSYAAYAPFRDFLKNSMLLPDRLPDNVECWWLESELRTVIRRFRPDPSGKEAQRLKLLALRRKIEAHIQEQIIGLIPQLQACAAARQATAGDHSQRMLQKRLFGPSTFALVAGQAAHFRPLRAALEKRFQRMGFHSKRMHVLKGSLAKEACCRGAVGFHLSMNERSNPDEIFGTYALMAAAPQIAIENFRPVDMKQIRNGHTIAVPRETTYWVVYSPRTGFSKRETPRLNDGTTAMLNSAKPAQGQFKIQYDPQTRQITVNNSPVSLATYGDINEEIYYKVWPELSKTIT
jgi:hypothetical protein